MKHSSALTPLWKELSRTLEHAQRIALLPSRKPDGDAMGSAVAVAVHLTREGKPWVLFSPDPVPSYLEYLPFTERTSHNPASLVKPPCDLVLTFDSASWERAGLDVAKLPSPKPTIVNIDHHHTNTQFGDLNIIAEDAASTTEMLYDFFSTAKIALDRDIATALLTGILTDTGNFAYANTSLKTLSVAGELLRRGGNLRTITFHTLRNKRFETLRLWGRALARLVWNEELGTVTTVITEQDLAECHASHEATDGIANFLNSLGGVRAVLVLTQEGSTVKGSFRTTRDDVDVAELASHLGGGGHQKAAGFSVEGSLVEMHGRWQVR